MDVMSMKKIIIITLLIILGLVIYLKFDDIQEITRNITGKFSENTQTEEKLSILNKRIDELEQLIIEQKKFINDSVIRGDFVDYEKEGEFLLKTNEYKDIYSRVYLELENNISKKKYDEARKIIESLEVYSPKLLTDESLNYGDYEDYARTIGEGFKELFKSDILRKKFEMRGYIQLENIESECSVFLDGKEIDKSQIIKIDEQKEYLVEIKKHGFKDFQKKVSFSKEMLCLNFVFKINYEPVRKTGSIFINYENVNSLEIFLDGQKVNKTHLENVSVGKHMLKLIKKDYISFEEEILIFEGEVKKVYPEFSKVFLINSNLTSKVTENGYYRGNTPLNLKLKEGVHNISVIPENKVGEIDFVINTETDKRRSMDAIFESTLLINSNLNDYEVFVNGEYENKCSSPEGNLSVKILPGSSVLNARRRGYKDITMNLFLKHDDTKNINLEFISDTGKVTIMSEEKNCQVFIDEKFIGNTPITINKDYGKHVLKIIKEGFEDIIHEFEIDNSELSLNFSMKKASIGKKLVSDVSNCEVYLDGNFIGISPVYKDITVGIHTLTMKKKGYKSNSYQFNTEIEPERIILKMEQEKHLLSIKSDVSAQLFMNNQFYGYTPFLAELQPLKYEITAIYDGERKYLNIDLNQNREIFLKFKYELQEKKYDFEKDISCFGISNKNKFAVGFADSIYLYNPDGTDIKRKNLKSEVKSVCFLDEETIFIGLKNGEVYRYDFADNTLEKLFQLKGWILDLDCNDNIIAACSRDGEVLCFNFADKKHVYHFKGNKYYPITSIAISKDDYSIFSTSEGKLYASDLKEEKEIYGHDCAIKSVDIDENNRILSCDKNGNCMLVEYDFKNLGVRSKKMVEIPFKDINNAKFNDGRIFVSGCDGTIVLMNEELKAEKRLMLPESISCTDFKNENGNSFLIYSFSDFLEVKLFN